MAVIILKKGGRFEIPHDMNFFYNGTTLYCFKDYSTGRLFLSTSPYENGEMYCGTEIIDGYVAISEDAIKYLFRDGKTSKVSVTVNYSGDEKKLLRDEAKNGGEIKSISPPFFCFIFFCT